MEQCCQKNKWKQIILKINGKINNFMNIANSEKTNFEHIFNKLLYIVVNTTLKNKYWKRFFNKLIK